MGIECETAFQFSFIYKAQFENGLTEHELDHVYFGNCDELPEPDIFEAKDWKYISLDNLQNAIDQNPQDYSFWLKICLPEVIKKVQLQKQK